MGGAVNRLLDRSGRRRKSSSSLAVILVGLAVASAVGVVVAQRPRAMLIAAAVVVAALVVARGTLAANRRLLSLGRELTRAAPRLDTLQYVGVGSLAVAMLAISWNGVRLAPGLAVSDPFLMVAAAAWIASPRTRTRLSVVPGWMVWSVYLLLLAMLVSALTGLGPLADASEGVRLGVAMVLTTLVIGTVGHGSGLLGFFIDLWLASVAVSAAVGVADIVAGTSIGTSLTGVEIVDRAAGLTTQVNHLAVSAAMAVPVAFSRFAHAHSPRQRFVYAMLVTIAVMGCLVSGSRAGVIGLVVGLAVLPLIQPSSGGRIARWMVIAAAVMCVVLLAIPGDSTTIAVQRLTGSSGVAASVSDSDRERSVAIRDALERINESPVVGSGFGELRRAHSVYLQLYAAGGVLGILAFAFFTFGPIREGVRLARAAYLSSALAGVAAASSASIIALVVMSIRSNQLFDRYLFVPAGLILAVHFLGRDASTASED
jgi:hypothetical protein